MSNQILNQDDNLESNIDNLDSSSNIVVADTNTGISAGGNGFGSNPKKLKKGKKLKKNF